MESIEKDWRLLAERQHGAISRAQLSQLGLSARQIEGRASAGELARVARGVYRVIGSATSYEQRAMLACLATDGVASHRCAAALWQLRRCDTGLVEVTVANRRAPLFDGAVVHSTDRLRAVDRSMRRAIPVTSPGRTLLDLGAVAPPRIVESALEDALQRGLVSVDWLARTVDRLGGSGRSGSGVLRHILGLRPAGAAPTESVLEDDIVRLLVASGLPQPVRQHEIAVPGGGTVRLDVSYPPVRLAIEGQSVAWHTGRESLQRDCDKLNLLVSLGWRLLVFTWDDVHRRADRLVHRVAREFSRELAT